MPRAYHPVRRPTPRATEADPEEDLSDWGTFEDGDTEDDDDAPPPPPPPPENQEKPEEASELVKELGLPPGDTVAAAKWAYQLHMRLAYDAMMDARLTPSQRRKEVRVTLAGAAKHTMDALRYDALEVIRKDREEMERKARGKAAAKQQKAPKVPRSAKIIPVRNG
jgi:hypothetical protein